MSSDTEIRPFQIDMSDEAVADLRRRIDAMMDEQRLQALTTAWRVSVKPSYPLAATSSQRFL